MESVEQGWTIKTLDYALKLEEKGLIDRDCPSCQRDFIPRLKAGASFSDIFAPNHKASERCKSGRRPHCTCDTCF